MKTWLVGYSADKGGREALALGAMLAQAARGRLVVAAILPQTWDHPSPAMVDGEYAAFLQQHARRSLANARAALPAGVPAEFLSRHAESAATGLHALAQETGADAIVLGSSRKAAPLRFQQGTVADELLRSASLPVALAPKGYVPAPARLRRVTCAIAPDEGAADLARRAGRIATDLQVPLRLASFVMRDRQMYPTGAGYDVENLVANHFRAQAQAVHQRILADWPDPSRPQSVLGDGRRWKDAVAALEWLQDELLVLGSSRMGGLMRVFVGSNAGKILRHAPVPRLILPRL